MAKKTHFLNFIDSPNLFRNAPGERVNCTSYSAARLARSWRGYQLPLRTDYDQGKYLYSRAKRRCCKKNRGFKRGTPCRNRADCVVRRTQGQQGTATAPPALLES